MSADWDDDDHLDDCVDTDDCPECGGEGERKGREEAAGAAVADLMEKLDALSGELDAHKALVGFYAKTAADAP